MTRTGHTRPTRPPGDSSCRFGRLNRTPTSQSGEKREKPYWQKAAALRTHLPRSSNAPSDTTRRALCVERAHHDRPCGIQGVGTHASEEQPMNRGQRATGCSFVGHPNTTPTTHRNRLQWVMGRHADLPSWPVTPDAHGQLLSWNWNYGQSQLRTTGSSSTSVWSGAVVVGRDLSGTHEMDRLNRRQASRIATAPNVSDEYTR